MSHKRAAIYCHADQALSSKAAEQELRRQQELLERYANERNMELISCYLHVGASHLDLNDHVTLHMLRDSKQKSYDVILLECFEVFPKCSPSSIPPVRIFSVTENRMTEIGESDAPFLVEGPKHPPAVVVYSRYDRREVICKDTSITGGGH